MKTNSRMKRQKNSGPRLWWLGVCLTSAAVWAGAGPARAAETNRPVSAPQMFEGGAKTYDNWIEFSVGGLMTQGNAAQAEQNHKLQRGAFGGIEDFHLQQTVATNTTFTMDGRALFDQHDYKLSLDLRREETGFLRFNYENSRTWYNGAGGFYPPTGLFYSLGSPGGDALFLDRGEISFEAGLALKDLPKVTFKYTHRYRDGEKSSTVWGPVHPDPVAFPALVRGLAPGFYDLDEKADIFQLDVSHHIKKTELGLGLRYETGELNNALKTTPGQLEPIQQRVTDRQGTSYDLLSVHAFTETWLKKDLFFSSGFLFANLDNAFSGSRIYGDDFDVGYVPGALRGLGYYSLDGGSHKQEYVWNLNLMATPIPNLSITPSVRMQKEDWNANSSGLGTLRSFGAEPFTSLSSRDTLDVRERLDLRYTAVTNWVFYGAGEWTQGEGNLRESGGLSQINGIGVPPIQRQTEDSRFFQKYSLGARWYPARRMSIDVGGYYKLNSYDYEHRLDSTSNDPASANRYPAYLAMQGFETYDGSLRLTLRPLPNVSLVSRYEYQLSKVQTAPDPVSGLAQFQSSDMTSHIFAQNVAWTPWSRLSLQAGFNYVVSETRTPASAYTRAVLNAQNNYWTLNFNAGFVLDQKTDLNLGYFYYRADDYADNSALGLPLGAGAEEHGVTATLTRRISQNLRLNLKYGYYHYTDALYGGHNDCESHVVFASLQYRF
jgi:hypothetical protein